MKRLLKILLFILTLQLTLAFADPYAQYHILKINIYDHLGAPISPTMDVGGSEYLNEISINIYCYHNTGDEKFTHLMNYQGTQLTDDNYVFIPFKKADHPDWPVQGVNKYTGIYKIELNSEGYGFGFANEENAYQTATFVSMNPYEAKMTLNCTVNMTVSRSITGYVRDISNNPISGAKVTLFNAYADLSIDGNSGWRQEVTTKADGSYTIPDLGQNDYFLKASVSGGQYFEQWYDDAYGYSDRTTVSITAGDVSAINFNLRKTATINGTISVNTTGNTTANANVMAFLKSDYNGSGIFTWINGTVSDGSGDYSLVIPGGLDVFIKSDIASDNYYDMFFPQKPEAAEAATINLSPETQIFNYDLVLKKYMNITWNVAMAGVQVDVFGWDDWSDFIYSTSSNASGTYNLKIKLTDGKLAMLRYSKEGYVSRFVNPGIAYPHNFWMAYPDSTNNQWMIAPGSIGTITIPDDPLEPEAMINGTISVSGGSGSVVTVSVFDEYGDRWFSDTTINATGGAYSIGGLPAGSWLIKAEKDGCIGEYYGETASTTNATVVSTTTGNTVNNINISIAEPWTISGRVQDTMGSDISGAVVKAFEYVTGSIWVAEDTTSPDGTFVISGYNDTTIYLQSEKSPYITTLYNNKYGAVWDQSDPIVISSGDNLTGYDFSMPAMAAITGNITDGSAPIAGVTVSAFLHDGSFTWVAGDITDASGYYELIVSAGYDLMVKAEAENYSSEFYDDVSEWTSATVFNLAVSEINTGNDFSLEPIWTLVGDIDLAATATDIATVEIFEYNNWNNYITKVETAADGTFELTGTGDIYVMARISTGNWVTTIYPDQIYSAISQENKVTLNAGSVVDLGVVNIDLGGTISGYVSANGGTGAVITVNVFAQDGVDLLKQVTTNSTGDNYSINGVAAGSWLVKAEKDGLTPYYYGDTISTTDATLINLTAGSSAANIDIAIYEPWVISGIITEGSPAGPAVSGVTVNVFLYQDGYSWVAADKTNALGEYSISGHVDGSFFIKTEAFGAYDSKYYDDIDGDNNWASANEVVLSRGDVTNNIDFVLYISPMISGTVQSDVLGDLSGAVVEAYDYTTGTAVYLTQDTTTSTGGYVLRVPASTPIKLKVSRTAHYPQLYNSITDVNDWASAQTFNLPSAGSVSNIDFTLEAFWKAAGRIALSDGSSPYGGQVYITEFNNWSNFIASTNADIAGDYVITSNIAVPVDVMISYIKDGYQSIVYPDYKTVPSENNAAAYCSVSINIGQYEQNNLNITLQKEITEMSLSEIKDSIKTGPNPANPEIEPVHIGFRVDGEAYVRIKVYSLGGELIYSDSMQCSSGYNEFIWDGMDRFSRSAANGVYLGYVEIKMSDGTVIKKVNKIAILR